METGVLVKQAKQGDKEALVQLIMAQQQDYYKLAYVYMGNREDALDAMEDMIVLLYEHIPGLKKEEAFYSWSKTILVNCCKKILGRKKKNLPLTIQEEGHDGGFNRMDDKLMLEAHLARLSQEQQEVIRLRYYLELDYQGIAELTKTPLGTVKSRIFNGLKKLKESIGGEPDGKN